MKQILTQSAQLGQILATRRRAGKLSQYLPGNSAVTTNLQTYEGYRNLQDAIEKAANSK